ncbi:MAG: beta-ketoacyl-ACP synthase III [Streptosporangiaceae bacterium]
MKIPRGAPSARVLALGEYRPVRAVTNDEICQNIDSSDEWIRDRSGIVLRRFAAPDETVADMAVHAGSKAIAASGVSPEDIDLVIVASCTHSMNTPGAAAEVAHRVGAGPAGAMDVSAACAGFCYSLSLASDAVRCGTARHVLVTASEKLTDFIDPHDRTMAFLFGDGAGAAIVGPAEEPGIGPVAWGSDGASVRTITQTPSFAELKAAMKEGRESVFPAFKMDGPAVYRWAVTQIAPVCRQAMELAGVEPQELGAFVPHQANLRIVDALARTLKLPDTVPVARDIVDQGNTSSASIPLALHAMLDQGQVRSGEPALFVGFGAGLTYAGQVITIP